MEINDAVNYLIPIYESARQDGHKEALGAVLNAARAQMDACKGLHRDGFMCAQRVGVSKRLYDLVTPYRGCPRGAFGMPYYPDCEGESLKGAMRMLMDSKDFVLIGQDEDFVCVPKLWWEMCVKALSEAVGAPVEEVLASQRAGIRTLQKWDHEQGRYLPLNVPEGWNCKTTCDDMSERVNCPHCGRELPFGLTYASLEVHTAMGMGYGVCEECHKAEVERKMRARHEGDD